jgi:hypothetical protein
MPTYFFTLSWKVGIGSRPSCSQKCLNLKMGNETGAVARRRAKGELWHNQREIIERNNKLGPLDADFDVVDLFATDELHEARALHIAEGDHLL